MATKVQASRLKTYGISNPKTTQMKKQCDCKLPYVLNGTNTCKQCGNEQNMFLPIRDEKPITVKKEFNGTEYEKGEIVEVIRGQYALLVEIQNFIKGGWYRVKLPNGGFHETQILGAKIK